jgi:hypothetical protein
VIGNRHSVTEIFTEGRVAVRFGATDTVMDVSGFETQGELRVPQEMEEGD